MSYLRKIFINIIKNLLLVILFLCGRDMQIKNNFEDIIQRFVLFLYAH